MNAASMWGWTSHALAKNSACQLGLRPLPGFRLARAKPLFKRGNNAFPSCNRGDFDAAFPRGKAQHARAYRGDPGIAECVRRRCIRWKMVMAPGTPQCVAPSRPSACGLTDVSGCGRAFGRSLNTRCGFSYRSSETPRHVDGAWPGSLRPFLGHETPHPLQDPLAVHPEHTAGAGTAAVHAEGRDPADHQRVADEVRPP